MLESLYSPDILFISFVLPMKIIQQDVLLFLFFSLGFAQARKISQDRREQSWVSVWIST